MNKSDDDYVYDPDYFLYIGRVDDIHEWTLMTLFY